MRAGHKRAKVKEMIASVLLGNIYDTMNVGAYFDVENISVN